MPSCAGSWSRLSVRLKGRFDNGGSGRTIAAPPIMDILLKVLEWTAGLAALGWFIWWRLRRSEQTEGVFITKALVTGVLVFAMIRHVAPLALSGIGALVGVPLLA